MKKSFIYPCSRIFIALAFISVSIFSFPYSAHATLSDNDYYGPQRSITPKNRLSNSDNTPSGAFTYQVPIAIPPGRNGIEPSLALQYNSQNLNKANFFGYGWDIEIPYIQRVNKYGIEKLYTSHYFASSMSGDLEDISLSDWEHGTYGAKVDTGDFLKYSYSSTSDGWTVTDKKGTIYTFGTTSNTEQRDPGDSSKTYKWYLKEVRDLNNNYITYEYYHDNGQVYPYKIVYTGNNVTDGIFEIEFLREARDDDTISYETWFLVKTLYRIDEIQAKISGSWVKKYELAYTSGDNTKRSLLSSVTETGKDESSNTLSLPATTFTYQDHNNSWTEDTAWVLPEDLDNLSVFVSDINADSLPDIIKSEESGGTHYFTIWINDGVDGFYNDTANWTMPVALSGGGSPYAHTFLVDVDGDGWTDILKATDSSGSRKVYINDGDGTGWTLDSNYVIPFDLESSGNPDHAYRLMDVNGDGLIDAVRAEDSGGTIYDNIYINDGDGTGWTEDTSWTVPIYFSSSGARYNLRIFDVNGDGLTDLVYSEYASGSHHDDVYLNNGVNTWVQDTNWVVPIDFEVNGSGQRDVGIMDVNNDGLIDIVDGDTAALDRKVYLNKGDGTGWAQDVGYSVPVTFINEDVQYFDINGDGLVDFNKADTSGGTMYDNVYENDGDEVDLLAQITTNQGGTITPLYKATTMYKDGSSNLLNSIPFVFDTVYSITTNDGIGNTATETLSYENGRYYYGDERNRRFSGFNTVTTTNGLWFVTKNFYHQGNASDSSNGEYNDDDSKIGKTYRTEIYDNSSNKYAQSVYKWDKYDLGNGRDFVKLIQKIDFTYDGDGDHRDTAESYTYENTYGNLTQHITWGEVTGSGDGTYTDTGSDKFTTDYSYAVNTTDYVVGLVSEEETINQSSAKVKEVRRYYDSQSLGDVTDGNETKQEHWKVSSTYIDTEKTYNSYGLVTVDTDPRNFTTSYTYDANYLYPASITNAESHVTSFTYDYSLGQAKTMTDPNSRVFETVYDALDRVKEEKIPDIATPATLVTKTTVAYTDNTVPSRIQVTNHLDGSTAFDVFTYIDGFGRKIQERKEAEDSLYTVKDFIYNDIGKIEKESLPYFSSGTARTTATTNNYLYNNFTYDPLGRVKTMVNSLGTTTNTYDQWETITTDPKSVAKDTHHDAYNRLIQVDEHNGGSTYTTSYEYNGLSKLTKITDAAGNLRNFTYDGLGRRLTAEDLHASGDGTFGSWTYDYDASGNMTQSVDPKSQTINYTYDDINRVLTEDYTGTGGTEVTYVYDSGTNGTGHLYSAAVASGPTTVYTYNSRGSVASEAKTISWTTYTTSNEYDRQGNTTKIIYPDSAEAVYEYNTAGLLEGVKRKESGGSYTYIITDYDYAPTEKVAYKDFTNAIDTYLTYDPNKLYRLANMMTIDPPEESVEETASENLLTELLDIPQIPELAAEETLKTEKKSTEEPASTWISKLLVGKTATERANIKGREIAKINSIARTKRDAYDIEIVSMEAIEDGVQVFARAWKDGKQIGFGADGTVDMERFRIFNPPIMVPDKNGTYERKNEKGEVMDKYREDPKEALLQVIEQNLSVMKNVHDSENIIPGKQGKTTSTFYPNADPESTSVDGPVAFRNQNDTWANVRGGAGNYSDDSSAGQAAAEIKHSTTSNNFSFIYRGILLFDTAPITDTDVISSATLSVYGYIKFASTGNSPTINVFASNPSSNTSLTNADYTTLGTTALSTAITYGSFNDAGYNSFSLNSSGLALLNVSGVSKYGTREATYDATNTAPTWRSDENDGFRYKFADASGTTQDPKLVIEHSIGSVAPSAPTDLLTEGSTNPTSVSDTTPEFSAIYDDLNTSDTAGHYRIQVIADGGTFTSPLWDSTKTALGTSVNEGSRSVDISYGGTALAQNGTKYYWRIKFWDAADQEGSWSDGSAYFTMAGTPVAPTTLYANCFSAQAGTTNPTALKCGAPVFSAVFDDTGTSYVGKKYRIQVATASDFQSGVVWDSGGSGTNMADVADGARSANLIYGGDPLAYDGTTYYWRIKFWNDGSVEGGWSTGTNTFSTHTSKVFQDNHYTYDANGNITKIVDSSDTDSARTVNYTYDDLNRLTTATATDVAAGQSTYSHTYTYSNIGNFTNKSDVGNYSYSSTGKANPHAATTINSVTHTYDDNGNLTDDGTWDYTWDYKNRLIEADDGTDTMTYAYDHTGQRVSTNDGTTTRIYANKLYDKAGTSTTKHIYANGELIATVDFNGTTTTVYHAHTDHLTGTGVITSSTPTEIQTLDYYPFWSVRLNDKAGLFDEKRQYAGSEFDTDTGLNYMNARYYKSTIGKFMSQDPVFIDLGVDERTIQSLFNPQLMNSYSYSRNNPLGYTDKSGEFPDSLIDLWTMVYDAVQVAAGATVTAGGAVIEVSGKITGSQKTEDIGKKLRVGWAQYTLSETGDLVIDAAALATPGVVAPVVKTSVVLAKHGDEAAAIFLKHKNSTINLIKRDKIDGKVIITSDKIKDSRYNGENWEWVKKAYYNKDLGRDFHWMENVANWKRDQIKMIDK